MKTSAYKRDMVEEIILGLTIVDDEAPVHERAEHLFDYLNDRGHFKGSPLPIYEESSLAEQLQQGESEDLLEAQDEIGG